MKQSNFYILSIIFLSSGELFSQSIKPKDLIGQWTFSTDTTISQTIQKWYFKNDSILIRSDSVIQYTPRTLSYRIFSSDNTTILKTRLNKINGRSAEIFYSMRKISDDQFNLIVIKIEETRYDGVRETKKGHPSEIWVLKKIE
jgi:hypothetical protein